jgi:hypothetical protein
MTDRVDQGANLLDLILVIYPRRQLLRWFTVCLRSEWWPRSSAYFGLTCFPWEERLSLSMIRDLEILIECILFQVHYWKDHHMTFSKSTFHDLTIR